MEQEAFRILPPTGDEGLRLKAFVTHAGNGVQVLTVFIPMTLKILRGDTMEETNQL